MVFILAVDLLCGHLSRAGDGTIEIIGVRGALLTLLAAWLWWKWLSRRVREQKHSDSHLNQRGQQLIGRRFVLESPLVNGRGHMRVGDSSWPVSASEDLSAGTHVEVIAIEGITLIIRAVIA
nr:NfeD family protein [Escherichia coli]